MCHATPASSPSLFSFLFSFRLASPVSLRKHTPGSGSHWCLWSKPVNLGTWRLVPDPIAMAHAFAEPGYGTVVHTRENGFKCRPLFRGHTLFIERTTTTPVPIRLASNQPLPPRILQAPCAPPGVDELQLCREKDPQKRVRSWVISTHYPLIVTYYRRGPRRDGGWAERRGSERGGARAEGGQGAAALRRCEASPARRSSARRSAASGELGPLLLWSRSKERLH